MALNPLNFNFQPLNFGNPFEALTKGFTQGLEQRREQEQFNQDYQKRDYENMIKAAEAMYAPQLSEAGVQLKKAEAARAPFVGLTGPAQQIHSLEALKRMHGEDSPVYQMAQKAFDLQQANTESQLNSRNQYANTIGKRSSSSLGKLFDEYSEVKNGFAPGTMGSVELDQEEQQRLLGQYENRLLKEATDTGTRKSALASKKLDTTAEAIDIDALTSFSGPQGHARLFTEKANALAGKPSKEYLKYEENVTMAHDLANQIRQVLGLSITPSQTKILEELSNPTGFGVAPEVAAAKLKANLDLILKEGRQAIQALESPGGFGLETKTNPKQSIHQSGNINPFYQKELPNLGVSEQDVYFTAKEAGITPDEVIQTLMQRRGL